MPLPPEPVCAKFQPNIFDPSRCHDCLHRRHMHAGAGPHTEEATPAMGKESATGIRNRTGNRSETSVETRTVTGEEEVSPTVRDDSDSQSAVSIYCDVSGGCRGYRRSSVCILSPDCGLYTSDADDSSSTDSCADRSDSPELSSNTDDDYFPPHPAMTRLDRPAHRPDPREWMGEARARDAFSKTPGFRGERESRDSGYFSLGRAAGSRSLHDQSPPAPFRHFERGHPVFNTRNIEPKDTVPFRNRHVAAPPDRPSQEDQDKNQISPPADPYEIAVQVEAQVGPRSPSPTPFKIAESLASTGQKRQGSSYGKGNLSSHMSSSNQQPGRHDSSRLCSTLQSRSSSPTRGRGEGSVSLNTQSFDGGGPERRSRSPSQAPSGRGTGSGTLPRNFKTFASSVKSQGTTVSDFKSVLRKTSETNGVLSGRVQEGRSVSPLRKDYSTSSLTSLRNTEPLSISNGQRQLGNSYSSSPPRQDHGGFRDVDSSPYTTRGYSSTSQRLIRKSESVTSLSSRGHPGRCGSPIREGYDIKSQALLRNSDTWNTQNNLEQDNFSSRLARRSNDTTDNHLMLNKTVLSSYGGSRVNESRSSSPGRKSNESPGRYQPKNVDAKCSFSDSGRTSPRRTYDTPSKGLKSESGSFARSRDGRSSSPPRRSYDLPGASSLQKTESVTSLNHLGSSTSRTTNADSPGYSILRKITTAESNSPYQRRTTQDPAISERNSSSRSLRDSTYSLHSSSVSRPCSPSRTASSLAHRETISRPASRSSSVNRFSDSRRGMEERSPSPENHRPSRRTQSPSPPPLMQRNTSLQSSMDSSMESGGRSGKESGGKSREEYALLADVPRVWMIDQREEAVKPQNHQGPPGRQELFKPASHSLSRHPSRERDHPGGPDREMLGWGNLSRSHSSTSLFRQGCGPTGEEGTGNTHIPEPTQPDLLNFKKGWMSKMDDVGEWKKHWFVLTDAGLKYYRDSGAEEKDEPDGEIDLISCVKVSEFDVEKNYGFQIQTREGVVTLSAMTAGIRRNWIEVLRKSVQPSRSPDLTQLPDSSSDKENSHGAPLLSARRTSTRPNPSSPSQRRLNHVELSPLPIPAPSLPASQREAGEGQGREHSHWQEGRNLDTTSSQWEVLLSRKGPAGSDSWQRMEEEIENKWEEFERLPLKEMKALPISSQSSGQPANEALHREVASLRQQLETLRGGGGGGEGGGRGDGVGGCAGKACGPDAACRSSLTALERAHRHALQEVQRQHERQSREAQEEQERLLLEETRATAQAMEALKKAHKEQLEREVERATRLCGRTGDSVGLRNQLQADTQALQRELSGLSERYSHKCLELNRAQQDAADRERELSRRERDLDLLRKENQDLKARLVEAVGRSQSVGAGQGSGGVINDNRSTTSCELEVLVQVKEKEVEYLHQEIGCLRNELQALNTEKQLSLERHRELESELSGIRGRSLREVQSLKEHLRLALAALQEGQVLGNSLEH
ncbi:unnamed protein product [Lota lota]